MMYKNDLEILAAKKMKSLLKINEKTEKNGKKVIINAKKSQNPFKEEELLINEGDQLELFDPLQKEWNLAKNLKTNKVGFVHKFSLPDHINQEESKTLSFFQPKEEEEPKIPEEQQNQEEKPKDEPNEKEMMIVYENLKFFLNLMSQVRVTVPACNKFKRFCITEVESLEKFENFLDVMVNDMKTMTFPYLDLKFFKYEFSYAPLDEVSNILVPQTLPLTPENDQRKTPNSNFIFFFFYF